MRSIDVVAAFDVYLIAALAISLVSAAVQYWQMPKLVLSVRRRWPNVSAAVLRRMKWMFLTGSLVLPLGLAALVAGVHFAFRRLVWGGVQLSTLELLDHPWWALLVGVSGVGMVWLDALGVARRKGLDVDRIEDQLDLGEFVLRRRLLSAAATVLTFGLASPRKLLDRRLDDTVRAFGVAVARSSWRVVAVNLLRIAFGAGVWGCWWVAVRSVRG